MPMKIKTKLLLLLLLIALLCGCNQVSAEPYEFTGFAFGGLIQIKLYGETKNSKAAGDALMQQFQNLETLMSVNLTESELLTVNRQAGLAPVKVSEQTMAVLQKALTVAGASNGAFNPAIGPLVKLWQIGFGGAHRPAEAEIVAALPLLDYRDIVVNAAESTVFLSKAGMGLDFGAIAKGFAADQAFRILAEYQIDSALISINGNLLTVGEKPNHIAWKAAIADPRGTVNDYVGILPLTDSTISTSGDYERYFEQDGVRYHHLLDSKTGYPAASDLISASMICRDGALADALSTAVFVLGKDAGLTLLQHYPEVGYVLIDQAKNITLSSGLSNSFELTNPAYRLNK
ncbi:MAG: FAD:protein FMN transferase [Negativicutes bacterium]|nr:FAD:protein FMN transferase [Negativicutes bacterium]